MDVREMYLPTYVNPGVIDSAESAGQVRPSAVTLVVVLGDSLLSRCLAMPIGAMGCSATGR